MIPELPEDKKVVFEERAVEEEEVVRHTAAAIEHVVAVVLLPLPDAPQVQVQAGIQSHSAVEASLVLAQLDSTSPSSTQHRPCPQVAPLLFQAVVGLCLWHLVVVYVLPEDCG